MLEFRDEPRLRDRTTSGVAWRFLNANWQQTSGIGQTRYTCGHCHVVVGPSTGYFNNAQAGTPMSRAKIYICPNCNRPTFVDEDRKQFPGVPLGEAVQHLPADVNALYEEARVCTSAGAHTAAVLTLRKLLMNVAVSKEAKPDQSYLDYVNYLETKGYVPPDGREWVDQIRRLGNEANHEIKLMKQSEVEELIGFAELHTVQADARGGVPGYHLTASRCAPTRLGVKSANAMTTASARSQLLPMRSFRSSSGSI